MLFAMMRPKANQGPIDPSHEICKLHIARAHQRFVHGLYTANRCVTQMRLRVCLVHNSMAFANQQGLYACVIFLSHLHFIH